MSDKIEVIVGREYKERPVLDLMKVINRKVGENYPGYSLAWLLADVKEDVLKDEIEKIGVKDAKIVELDVNVLPFRHLGVLVPEGQGLLPALA